MNAQKVTTPYTQNTLYWSNLNIIAQKGCFLLYNYKEDVPVEEYVGEHTKFLPKIWCMDIHKSLTHYIQAKYLCGLSDEVLFPNIDQIAQSAYVHFKEKL